jgi:hypothetical protein
VTANVGTAASGTADTAAIELVRRTTSKQGLPERVADPSALDNLAEAFRPRRERKRGRKEKAA